MVAPKQEYGHSRERNRHKNHFLLEVGWQEPEGHLVWRSGMTVWRWGGLHLDGVQGKVKDRTLLWSEIPCFFSHHVVLEAQRQQEHQDSSGLSWKPCPHLPTHSSSLVFSFQCSKALPRQHITPPTPPQPQKDPTHPQYLEFGKMAQLLGSSEDQLCALGREGISQQPRTPNSDRKHGAWEGRQEEEVEGKCPYCLVSEWRQNNHPFHCVHHHPPELLQNTLQDRLLTHSGEEGEAAGPGNR